MMIDKKMEMAKKPHISPEMLAKLAVDENRKVRLNVAKNPNTPEGVLKELEESKYEEVRRAATENLNTIPEKEEVMLDIKMPPINTFVKKVKLIKIKDKK